MSAASDSSDSVRFARVVADEIGQINRRRAWLTQQGLSQRPGVTPAVEGKVNDVVGLSLSGGGIRSAASCLGVMQALNHHNLLKHVDYLSTVSGGGYIGASVTASMAKTGRFVFGAPPAASKAAAEVAAEISDTPAVGHIRNYSNYLIPNGIRDALTAAAIVVRGLVANTSLVLPVLLLLAATTIASNPDRGSLVHSDLFGYDLSKYLVDKFGITLVFGLAGIALFFVWAIYRSLLRDPTRLTEFHSWLPRLGAVYLVLLATIAYLEFQPFVIDGMFEIADAAAGQGGGVLTGLFTSWLQTLAAAAAPVAAAVMFFQRQFGGVLKADSATADLMTRISARLIKGAVWIAGAALPLFIWVAYLYLSYWGIINDKKYPAQAAVCERGSIAATVQIEAKGSTYSSSYRGPDRSEGCTDGAKDSLGRGTHTPTWLIKAATWTNEMVWGLLPPENAGKQSQTASTAVKAINSRLDLLYYRPLATFYLALGLLLFAVSWLLAPNANSLHQLYRDRLAKAFLFDPDSHSAPSEPKRNVASSDQGRDFEELDLPLTALASERAPYHLINTALNIQGSDFANRRGRNADFFVASPLYVGSEATGYQRTSDFEQVAPDLDLATAVAISGAAASSNMGSNSIKPLAPTLALLNVRLGYWLKNPKYLDYWRRMVAKVSLPGFQDPDVGSEPAAAEGRRARRRLPKIPPHWSRFYLLSEITGRLYENSDEIYLTDGGHIENLGIYELLRRRCRLIIAVDAEADSAMRFGSLVTLQRYARIDHGILIHLPWLPIQTQTLAQMSQNTGKAAAQPVETSPGPHVAIGIIDYGSGEKGYLVYLKSSLTGDENDYIRDYARRYDRFPHETTGDQFFSEEQFEVYRALGFHMAHGMLCGRDDVMAAVEAQTAVSAKLTNAEVASIGEVRQALGLSAPGE
jgi:hypothetical protein